MLAKGCSSPSCLKDVDWNHNQIHVKRSLWEGQVVSPKTKSSVRRVDMTPTLAQALRKHKFSCSIKDSGFLFCNAEGKPLSPDSIVRRQFLPALERAGVKRVRFHDLRHTECSIEARTGAEHQVHPEPVRSCVYPNDN